MKIDRISSAFLFIVGAVVAREGSMLQYVKDNTPGPGFLPLWLGATMMLLSALLFMTTRAKDKPLLTDKAGFRKAVRISAALLVYALAVPYIGMFISMALFLAFLTAYVERRGWKQAVAVSGTITVSCFLLFQLWLGIQLPRGLFINSIF